MTDHYKVTILKDETQFDITEMIGNLSWTDNLDTLGVSLTFNKAYSDEQYMQKYDSMIDVGDKITLTNNGASVFQGIVTDESINGKFGRSYTAYDYMFYFNKSKLKPTQIKKQTASNSIADLCNQLNIPVYQICSISTVVKAIYKYKTFAEILKDILEKATQELGERYKAEMYQGKLYIEELSKLQIQTTYQLAENIAPFNPTNAISNVSKTRSIVDMSNSVIVTSSEESNTSVLATVSDSESVGKYGLLQTNISVDNKNLPQASNIAKNKLKELNRIIEDVSIDMLGDDSVKSGRIIEIIEPITKLLGKYLVTGVTHNYSNSIHTMSLNLERWSNG